LDEKTDRGSSLERKFKFRAKGRGEERKGQGRKNEERRCGCSDLIEEGDRVQGQAAWERT